MATTETSAGRAVAAVAHWFALALFLSISVLVVGRSIGAASLLSKSGLASIASLYVAQAVTVALLSLLLERWTRHRESLVGLLIALLAQGLGLASLAWLDAVKGLEANFLWFALALLVESAGFLVTVQFWTVATAFFPPESANRWFPWIGSGGILGSIAGGLATHYLAGESMGQLSIFLLLALAAEGMVVSFIWRKTKQIGDHQPKSRRQWNAVGDKQPISLAVARVRLVGIERQLEEIEANAASRSLQAYLACVACLTIFTTTMIDFYNKLWASLTHAQDTVSLVYFFGNFYIGVGLFTLFVQLVGTRYLLNRGQGLAGLWVMPVGLGLASWATLVWPSATGALLLKMMDSVMTHSIQRGSQEWLCTTFPAAHVRAMKARVDGYLGRLGLLSAGLTLWMMSLVPGLVHPWSVVMILLVATLLWTLAVWGLTRHFRLLAKRSEQASREIIVRPTSVNAAFATKRAA